MKVLTLAGKVSPAIIALSAVLVGCSGLGEGVLPVSASIQPLGGLNGATTAKTYTCLNTGVSLFVTFSNGAVGDFTGRASYTSSNPAVLQVSNLDIQVPDQPTLFYTRGTLVPRAAGTAKITVQYLSFIKSIDYTVSELGNFTVSPAAGNAAARSLLDYAVFADLDGVTTPVDSAVTWSLPNPNAAIATISAASGTVTGIAANATPLTVRATLPACGRVADATVAVANLQSLSLAREFGDNSQLIVGTTERVLATGNLDNGTTQDLTTQVSYRSSDTAALAFFAGSLSNLALAVQASTTPISVTASFTNPDTAMTVITAPPISITPVAGSLNSITVTPTTVDVLAGFTTQLNAIGSYASGVTQDITRHVTWTSGDTSSASVQSTSGAGVNGFAGLVSTANTAAGRTVTMTATATTAASTTTTASAAVNIK